MVVSVNDDQMITKGVGANGIRPSKHDCERAYSMRPYSDDG